MASAIASGGGRRLGESSGVGWRLGGVFGFLYRIGRGRLAVGVLRGRLGHGVRWRRAAAGGGGCGGGSCGVRNSSGGGGPSGVLLLPPVVSLSLPGNRDLLYWMFSELRNSSSSQYPSNNQNSRGLSSQLPRELSLSVPGGLSLVGGVLTAPAAYISFIPL